MPCRSIYGEQGNGLIPPILFTIFINDLPGWVSSNCRIFTDDTKLYNVTANCVQLQDDINDLQKWSEIWNLYFNADKCKVMHIGNNNQRCDYTNYYEIKCYGDY